jgi:phosphate-selective porin OprO/OprP
MKTKTSLRAGAALGALVAFGAFGAAHAQETTTAWKGAPQWTNDDVQFKVRGRILLDYVYQDVERDGAANDYTTSNTRGRQVFLGIEGKLNNYFAYKAEGGAVNGGAWSWDDVVIEFKPNDMTSLMVGNIKAAGIENLTSTRFTTMMDRGPYGDMGPDSYLLSGVAKVNGLNWTATAAVQGDSINSADVLNNTSANAAGISDSRERIGYTGRVTFAPVLTDDVKVHLGAWGRHRNFGDEAGFNYQARPNTNYGNRFISTGAIGNTDTTWGVEGVGQWKNLSLQGEYADIQVDRVPTLAGGNPDLKVGYAMVSFWPTGEVRNYDATKGEFGRPKILSPITGGGWGGVELAARYDYADLTEAWDTATVATRPTSALAGEYTAWTLGVNYYPTAYVRVQANYTAAEIDYPALNTTSVADTELSQFQMRVQLDF